MKRYKSIFFRLTLAFVLLGLLPLLAAGLLLYSRFQDNLERVVLEDMARMTDYAAGSTREMADECDELTRRIYDISDGEGRFLNEVLRDGALSAEERDMRVLLILNGLLDGDSRIRSVYFSSADGQLYHATRNTQKVLDEDAFFEAVGRHAAMNGTHPLVIPTHADSYFPDSGNEVFTMVRNYQDTTSFKTIGNTLGYVVLDFDLGKLSARLSDMNMGVNERFRIVDDAGNCVYSADAAENGTYLAEMDALLPDMQETSGSILSNGSYLVYSRLSDYGWNVTAQAGRSHVLSSIESTRRYTAVFLSAAFFLLLTVYFYFLKKIRKPVEQLEQGMEEIRQGKLETRIDLGGRGDEIGLLADGLNNMAEELEGYIKRVYVAEIRQREAELTALKSQIKPHYLYNTLEIIRMTALEHEDEQTARMVESLSKQLRYLIGYNSDMVPLATELDNIREYFYIMRIRYENRIQLEISADDVVLSARIIKLSLQPVVENAVKHGLRPKKEGGTVRIDAQRDGETLEITVMDDGVGMPEETLAALDELLSKEEMGVSTAEGWSHVGLKNACDRIKKNFGAQYGIEIMSTEGVGTVVVLRMPFVGI